MEGCDVCVFPRLWECSGIVDFVKEILEEFGACVVCTFEDFI